MKRVLHLLRRLGEIPAYWCMMWAYVDAMEDVRRHDYVEAEKRLLRVYEWAPGDAVDRTAVGLLMSLVALRLGNLSAAAELAPNAVRHVRALRVYANDAERAYL